MLTHDGTISISTEIDPQGFEEGLKNLSAAAGDFQRGLAETESALLSLGRNSGRIMSGLSLSAYGGLGYESLQQELDLSRQYAEGLSTSASFGTAALSGLSGALLSTATGAKDAGEAFGQMGQRVVSELINIIIQMRVLKPLTEWLGSAFGGGGGGGFLSGLFGGLFGSAHHGGIIGRENTGPARRVSPLAFLGASKFHNGGLVGLAADEVPIIARRGEMVLTQAQQAALAAGLAAAQPRQAAVQTAAATPSINVAVVNRTSSPAEAEASTKPGPDGSTDLTIILKEIDRGLADMQKRGRSTLAGSIENDAQSAHARAMQAYRKG